MLRVLSVLLLVAGPAAAQQVVQQGGQTAAAPAANDYPTEARAEYVFACMAVNGQTQDVLRRCSCSVDTVASILPFDDYTAAETVLRMRMGAGERSAMFRGTPATQEIVANLRRAQAEAEMMCF